MKPLVTFPDPEEAVVLYLRGFGIADDVTTKYPVGADGKNAKLTAPATHLQVELEVGGAEDYPITERAQVRVTAYTADGRRSDVKDLASLAQGHLYRMQTAEVAGVAPILGRSDVVTDPDTRNLMAWFLCRVDLKAILLAS